MAPSKTRVLYLLRQYPLVCETYIQAEIDALRPGCEVRVLSQSAVPDALAYAQDPAPWRVVTDSRQLTEEVREFQPDVLHMHWLLDTALLLDLARHAGVPFTIRAHSFDTLPSPYMAKWFRDAPGVLREAGRDELCRGILAFPFSRPFLEGCGVPPHKIHDCPPAVEIARFMDRSPNGAGVLNVGACLPKKNFAAYIHLATRLPGIAFDLYPVGYDVAAVEALNRARGEPVRIRRCVPHAQMPAVYKAHQWLVYTASPALANIGWPVAVAEAQASGCGVALANVRADLRDYVGEGAILFDRIDDLVGVIDRPVPGEMREAAFEKARESDIHAHLHKLTRLWPGGVELQERLSRGVPPIPR